MQILFLSRWYPYPTDNGSKLRIWNLLRGLSKEHEVTLLSFADEETADLQAPELRDLCEDIQVVPWKAYDPQSRKARFGFLSLKPRSYTDTFSVQMQSCIKQKLDSTNFDLVIASEWEMAGYVSCFGDKVALFEDVELGVFYGSYTAAASFYHKLRNGLTWQKHRRYLSRLLRDFDAVTVPSRTERDLLVNAVPNYENIRVIPNCINLADYVSVHSELVRNSLIFTGSFRYTVNYDAMIWFLQDIYPFIQSEIADVQLTITGDHADRKLSPATAVIQTGFVPDVRPYIASAWASVVPLRSGGGTRLKILEAMALGTPVITTTKGAEGIDLKHGFSALIADEPEEFALAVNRLFKEPGLREHLASNAYQLVRDHYDWAGEMPRFMRLIDDTVRATQNKMNPVSL